MRPFDGKALGEQVVTAVRTYVARALATVNERFAAVEARIAAIPAGPQGERGESIKGEKGDDGKDGNSVFSGEGKPDKIMAKSGDHYIDVLTGDIYRCD